MYNKENQPTILTTLIPFLVVDDCARAIEFYIKGLGATEVIRYEEAGGRLSAKLAIDGAEFHLGDEEVEFGNRSPRAIGGSPVRLVITVSDPDLLFSRALAAGATQICPVTTEDTWRIGKLKDPFGHIWEIGRPLADG